jgi:hypothetical protein
MRKLLLVGIFLHSYAISATAVLNNLSTVKREDSLNQLLTKLKSQTVDQALKK